MLVIVGSEGRQFLLPPCLWGSNFPIQVSGLTKHCCQERVSSERKHLQLPDALPWQHLGPHYQPFRDQVLLVPH